VDIDEFVSGCTRLRGPAKALDLAVLIFEVRRMMEDLMDLKAEMHTGWSHLSEEIHNDNIPANKAGLVGIRDSEGFQMQKMVSTMSRFSVQEDSVEEVSE